MHFRVLLVYDFQVWLNRCNPKKPRNLKVSNEVIDMKKDKKKKIGKSAVATATRQWKKHIKDVSAMLS
jgi:hypothetical protein